MLGAARTGNDTDYELVLGLIECRNSAMSAAGEVGSRLCIDRHIFVVLVEVEHALERRGDEFFGPVGCGSRPRAERQPAPCMADLEPGGASVDVQHTTDVGQEAVLASNFNTSTGRDDYVGRAVIAMGSPH